ncbi:FecR domain-containing protein [Entomospira entomophila]|uniref:FecR domain-containing protein n=1 Tax=Entomospira entomophila TaxID=2719988 RepID=A0A968KQQ1_9SPIO|nr:FecR domain-containing protein [Entomospira entomophilus]NIZ39928.1 FecR domain-containing protein [Entomospira entomophilus]WDI35489.1 FecR domain-containing protein [Entomospira entomophilus]
MKIRTLCVGLSLILIVLYTGCFFKQKQNSFLVTVSAYFGEAYVIRNGEKIPIHLRLPLELGDILEVIGEESYVQLLFHAGAAVMTRNNALMEFPSEGVVRLIQGESSYHIEPQQVSQFTVKTEYATLTVLGTRFSVHQQETTEVIVFEGSVSVQNNHGSLIESLNAGERLSIDASTNTDSLSIDRHDSSWNLSLLASNSLRAEEFPVKDPQNSAPTTNSAELLQRVSQMEIQIQQLRNSQLRLERDLQKEKERASSFELMYWSEVATTERYRQLLEQLGADIQ